MEEKKCSYCSKMIPKNSKTCPYCLKNLSFPLWLKVVLGLIVLALIGNLINNKENAKNRIPSEQAAQVKTMTTAEHLTEAKKALSGGRVTDAKDHLSFITETSPEYAESRVLLMKVARREKEIEKTSKIVAATLMIEQRKQFAKTYEKNLLDQGMDVYASTYGKDNTVMEIKFVLINRPFVHNFLKDASAIATLRSLGFKKLILTDGYDSTWSVNL